MTYLSFAEVYLDENADGTKKTIPEIKDGKDVTDFIDPDIAEKLEALESEE